jgi:hypothetical protein
MIDGSGRGKMPLLQRLRAGDVNCRCERACTSRRGEDWQKRPIGLETGQDAEGRNCGRMGCWIDVGESPCCGY